MYGRLLRRLPRQNGAGPVPDEERCRKRVSPQDGQVQETVALGILDVKVTLVAHQSVSDAFMTVQQRQVERRGTILVGLVQFLWELNIKIFL